MLRKINNFDSRNMFIVLECKFCIAASLGVMGKLNFSFKCGGSDSWLSILELIELSVGSVTCEQFHVCNLGKSYLP